MEKDSFFIDKDFDVPNVFKNILKCLKIPLLIVGLDGKIKFFNPYYKKILGNVELNIGMSFLKYIHPDDIDLLKILYEKGIKDKKSYINEDIEFRIRRNDGKYVWISTHTESYINDRGDIKGFVSVLKDITQKKDLEYSYLQLKKNLEKINMKIVNSSSIKTGLNEIEKTLEGICLLFNMSFDPDEMFFWMGIENISKLFTSFVEILLESTGCSELQKQISKIDLEFKVTDEGHGYLQLKKM